MSNTELDFGRLTDEARQQIMAEDADGRLKFVEPNDCAPGMIIQ